MHNKEQNNNCFANIKIEVKEAEKMSETQRIKFVSDFFETVKA
ncbi:hypothetical protein J2W95_001079 [Flavobacterium granuli]|uniref:Uncharacterized protein n=1 Tax=Flavobacterium granuli TaxID=280093 RepID=A0ABU1S027_9FLAO|nr:hypothetical protein [Flavobacterium granuli]